VELERLGWCSGEVVEVVRVILEEGIGGCFAEELGWELMADSSSPRCFRRMQVNGGASEGKCRVFCVREGVLWLLRWPGGAAVSRGEESRSLRREEKVARGRRRGIGDVVAS